jgi:hypothetical protein
VLESTLEAPPVPETANPPTPAPRSIGALLRRHVWWVVGLGIVAVSAILVLWADTRPSFDAYGWLVWGYHTLHGDLDLGGAPSWKPLPYLFTVPYALFGSAELWLWMITAVAISFGGCVFAGRIAYRLVGAGDPERRGAAIAAAIFAGLAVLGIEDYMHYILSVQSDPVIVALCLGAIDNHLCGRHRWAFALGVLAALGRPEVWPFVALYAIWAWRAIPSMRWFVTGGLALIAFMWFGIPTITNNRPFVAGQLAQNSPRELHSNKVFGTIGRFTELHYLPIWIAAVASVVVAFYRRNRIVLYLAAGCLLWVVVEIAFALHGWPALPRYVMEPAGVAAVLAGVGVGWAVDAPWVRRGLPRWTGIAVVAILVITLVPGAVSRLRTERTDLRHERERTHEIAALQGTINALGGYRFIRSCGHATTQVEFLSVLGWFTHLNIGVLGHNPTAELRQRRYPVILFTPLPNGGWSVLPWRLRRHSVARCSALRATFVVARGHPDGPVIRR